MFEERIRTELDAVHAPEALKEKAMRFATSGRKKASRPAAIWSAVAASVAAVCVFFFIGIYGSETAYISLDVNPSIALAINDYGRVIDTAAYNEEATEILEDADVENDPYEEAVSSILECAPMQLYLQDTSDIWIAVQANDPEREVSIEETVAMISAGALAANYPDVTVRSTLVSEDTRRAGEEAGVTAGKYVAIEELQAVDPGATIDDYRDATIGEIHSCVEAHHAQSVEQAVPEATYPAGTEEVPYAAKTVPPEPVEPTPVPETPAPVFPTPTPVVTAAPAAGHHGWHHGESHHE